ncbi:MAG: hypothetical protein ACE5QF_08835 [Thermoplasmata archaeon]
MLDDNVYNLMEQATTESKSLWRIRNHYKKDAEANPVLLAFWKEMEGQKEQNVMTLTELVRAALGEK